MSTDKKREDAKHKQEMQALQEKNDWQWLLSDERGQRILYRALGFCGIHRSAFTANALTQAFNEGQRNVGLYLWERLARHVPEKLPRIMEMRDSDA